MLPKFIFTICEGFPGGRVLNNFQLLMQDVRCEFDPLFWEDTLEEKMVTHSRVLVWEISWTEESGRPQSMVSQSHTWPSNWAHTNMWSQSKSICVYKCCLYKHIYTDIYMYMCWLSHFSHVQLFVTLGTEAC